jgi:hypothetical protein
MASSDNKNVVFVSVVIIVLLVALFGLCIRGYLQATSRRFSKMSTIFFGCMGLSLLLELPKILWYAISPSNDFNNYQSLNFVQFSHFIAISGFTFCMGIPICVWAGMVTGTEIDIFEMRDTNFYKAVLHISIALSVVNIIVTGVVYFSDYEQAKLRLYFTLAMVVSQLLISLTWLCVGISLQRVVACTAVGSSFNVVFSLNFVILLVFLCYLTRTAFNIVLNFILLHSAGSLICWYLVGGELVPYCIGNFLLIRLMTASLKYEHRIESRLLKSSRADSVSDIMFLTLLPDEYAEVPVDEN